MSSFLCFICHSTVSSDTNEDIREKYKDVVGINLCPDSHLCYICCHVLNKLWLFKSICLKRSLEYPVLFSEKGTLNLQRTVTQQHILCDKKDICSNNTSKHPNIHQNYSYENFNNYLENYDDFNNFDVGIQNYSIENEPYRSHLIGIIGDQDYQLPDLETEQNEQNNENYILSEDVTEATMDSSSSGLDSGGKKTWSEEVDLHKDQNEEITKEATNNDCIEDFIEQHKIVNPNIQNNTTNEQTDTPTEHIECDNDNFESKPDIEYESTKTNIFEADKDVIVERKEIDELMSNVKKKSKKSRKKFLTEEEQKASLEARRKEKKYLDSEFKCYNCALGFLFKDTYQAHMMRHEESNGEFVCNICTLRFASASVLRVHCGRHRDPSGRRAKGRQRDQTQSHTCHLCANVYKNANALQQHIKRFHINKASKRSYTCNVCGESYNNQASVRTHMIKHINRKFPCDCGAKFSSPYTLTQHKKTHAEPSAKNRFFCDSCGTSYDTRKSLLAHKRNSLNHPQNIIECPLCGRICPNNHALTLHMEAIHSAAKNYVCPLCSARYTNRKSLQRHVKSHTVKKEPKVAVCHLCGSHFKGNNKLNRHLREVCEKAKLEEQLSAYYEHENL